MNKIEQLLHIVVLVLIAILLIILVETIQLVRTELKHNPYTESSYSNEDVELALLYHGIDKAYLNEVNPYFIDKDGNKNSLFTKDCIKWIKEKKGVK